jgi:rifampicin phosphotransferase
MIFEHKIASWYYKGDISEEVTRNLTKLGEGNAYAVRSSATAEDLPLASFAGQQDTYLNI